jgi:ubiquitin-protein ligase
VSDMSALPPRDRRLVRELEAMKQLAEDSAFVRFEAMPEVFPEEYVVTFTCLGLVKKPQEDDAWLLRGDWGSRRMVTGVSDTHIAHLYLPAGYPVLPPLVQFKTPLFHPNIRTLSIDDLLAHMTEETGGIEDMRNMLERSPELRKHMASHVGAYVCLDALKSPEDGGNHTRRITLYDICNELGQMIMFQKYNLRDPWNTDAAAWTATAERLGLLPFDNRPFVGRGTRAAATTDQRPGTDFGIVVIEDQ